MADERPANGWTERKSEVLFRLEKIEERLASAEREIQTLREETARNFATLNLKSGLWSAAGGLIPIAVLLSIEYMKGK